MQVVLPAVSIHFATQDSGTDDRWIFDYSLTFSFVDETGQVIRRHFSSVRDGLRGVILDKDNRDHYRILSEAFGTPPALDRPVTNAVLSRVTLDLVTHDRADDNKDFDTRLNVHVVNRLSATSAQDIAIGLDLFPGQAFTPRSTHTFSWSSSPGDGALAGEGIRLADIVLPVVYLIIVPNGHDQWNFDYQVTYEFTDPHSVTGKQLVYSSRTGGVILDQDNPKHEGVYQGAPFPTVSPPTAPVLTERPVDRVTTPKMISIPFLQRKLDEFVNSRTGSLSDPNPPLLRIRMDHTERFSDDITPESFLDLQSLVAGNDDVHYVSGPSSLGQLDYHQRLQDINSTAISLSIDSSSRTPLTAAVTFETGGPVELASTTIFDIDFTKFSITLALTLDLAQTTDASGHPRTMVDVLSWVAELEDIRKNRKGMFLGEPVDLGSDDDDDLAEHITDHAETVIRVSLGTNHAKDPERRIRRTLVDKIYAKLSTPDVLTGRTARDALNSQVTSLLLGGIADDDHNTDQNNTIIHEVGIQTANPEFGIPEDRIVIAYTGPRKVFVPAQPAGWPAGHDFSPGALANIEHLVVLTMENRSFDHIFGYLSLPVSSGGRGRTDVDGLTGHETNPYQGTSFPSFPLTGTIFSPDPPHGYEPVHHAINGGQMDGFVKSFAEARGGQLAAQIMGHQTAATVPVHDALARDFSIGHRWFAAHPGPTFCNRFYELTGQLNLGARGFWEFDNSSPIRPVFTETIFDHLRAPRTPRPGSRLPGPTTSTGTASCASSSATLSTTPTSRPQTTPSPASSPWPGPAAAECVIHRPAFRRAASRRQLRRPASADLALGQDLVRRVVEAVVSSPAWDKTMLVIVYDEHGGFYDHVPPPSAARVSDDLPITTHGLRVPAIVVSPWAGRRDRLRPRRRRRGAPGRADLRPHLDPQDHRAPVPQHGPAVHGCPLRRRQRSVVGDARHPAHVAVPPVHPLHPAVQRVHPDARRAVRQPGPRSPARAISGERCRGAGLRLRGRRERVRVPAQPGQQPVRHGPRAGCRRIPADRVPGRQVPHRARPATGTSPRAAALETHLHGHQHRPAWQPRHLQPGAPGQAAPASRPDRAGVARRPRHTRSQRA